MGISAANPRTSRARSAAFWCLGPGEDVAKLTYYGLYALQHRGQEVAGIAVGDGSQVLVFKDLGLVSQVFDEQTLGAMVGHVAVGHRRYSTTGSTTWENAAAHLPYHRRRHGRGARAQRQPVNTAQLAGLPARELGRLRRTGHHGLRRRRRAARARRRRQHPSNRRRWTCCPKLKGAFCPDVHGRAHPVRRPRPARVRPLSLGWLDRGWWLPKPPRSTSSAPLLSVTSNPVSCWPSTQTGAHQTIAEPTPRGCVFEYVYLARPDSVIHGRSVNSACVDIGRLLARENPATGDLVILVPESGTLAAIGFAQESGIPYGWDR